MLLYSCSTSALREKHSDCHSLCASCYFKKWYIWCLFGPHNLPTLPVISVFNSGYLPFCFTSFLPLCRPGDLCVSLAQHQCSQNCQEKVAFHKIVFSPFSCIWAHVFVDDWHPSYNALDCIHLWISLTILVLSPLTLALLEILELYPICTLMQRVGNDA